MFIINIEIREWPIYEELWNSPTSAGETKERIEVGYKIRGLGCC